MQILKADRIITDASTPPLESAAVLVDGGKVVAVGDLDHLVSLAGPDPTVIDLAHRT